MRLSARAIPTEIWVPLLVRSCIALLARTFFAPDEYFQALEPAHRAVFGYGSLTWEWLAVQPIRSFVFPSFYVPPFYVLKLLRLDGTRALVRISFIWAPKLLNAAFASITDYSVYRLAGALFGEEYSPVALFLSSTSFFNVLVLSRSLSNSVETSFTILALAHFPWKQTPSRRTLSKSLAIAAIACAIRPTNAIIWVAFFLLYYIDSSSETILSLGMAAIPVAFPALLTICVIDSIYYGRFIFTPLNFLQTNMSSVSLFYGERPWHYYLTQGIPILCTTSLSFVLRGWYNSIRGRHGTEVRRLAILVCIPLLVYSLAGHKEWRFIYPILPNLHVLAAKELVDLYDPDSAFLSRSPNALQKKVPIRKTHFVLLVLSTPFSIYVMRYHGHGQIAIMHHLREMKVEIKSVGFVMPCHSTPWQSYLHRPELDGGRLWGLGCEPPLRHEKLSLYKDQTKIFYDDPIRYFTTFFPASVNTAFPPSPRPVTPPGGFSPSLEAAYASHGLGHGLEAWEHEWPEFLVLYEALLPVRGKHRSEDHEGLARIEGVEEMLVRLGYREVWRSGWNGFEGDARKRGELLMWKWIEK
ncbi:hypothetical protein DL93DRAFT_2052249 [Clavulina sp. PMI_390]|nr:hypothetical protein DL93DRAFT_2052249 [Clavulina sp. PMI_390]